MLVGCGDDGASSGSAATTGAGASSAPSTTLASSDGRGAVRPVGPTCTLTPEQTEAALLLRRGRDPPGRALREDREGTPLRLAIRLQTADGCEPVRDGGGDLALRRRGDLLGVRLRRPPQSRGLTLLRGAQVTPQRGRSRVRHRLPRVAEPDKSHPRRPPRLLPTVPATQLYFDDAVTDAVLETPYARRGERDTRNGDDSIFDPATLLTLGPMTATSVSSPSASNRPEGSTALSYPSGTVPYISS